MWVVQLASCTFTVNRTGKSYTSSTVLRHLVGHLVEPGATHVPPSGSHCSSSCMLVGVTGIPTGPAGPHGPPPVGPPGPHGHPHPGSVAAAQLEAAERLALSTDPMVRLQMAGISPEYHAHTHAHTHAHSHTHLHLHPSQQAQQAQAQEAAAAAAAAGTAGFPLPGEWYCLPHANGNRLLSGQCHHIAGSLVLGHHHWRTFNLFIVKSGYKLLGDLEGL